MNCTRGHELTNVAPGVFVHREKPMTDHEHVPSKFGDHRCATCAAPIRPCPECLKMLGPDDAYGHDCEPGYYGEVIAEPMPPLGKQETADG